MGEKFNLGDRVEHVCRDGIQGTVVSANTPLLPGWIRVKWDDGFGKRIYLPKELIKLEENSGDLR